MLKMKRILCLCAVLMLPIIGNANPFKYNKTVEFNIGYTVSNWISSIAQDELLMSGYGIGISVYGIYADIGFTQHGDYYINHMLDKHSSYRTIDWHIGYAIPFCSWFKIIPVIGQSHLYYGRIFEPYKEIDRVNAQITNNSKLDYGAILQFTLCHILNLQLEIERYNLGASIGIRIPLYK